MARQEGRSAPPSPAVPAPAAPPPPAPEAVAAPSVVAVAAAATIVAEPVATQPAAAAVAALDLAFVSDLWPAVLDTVREQSGLLAYCLKDASPISLESNELVVAFPPAVAFNRKRAEDSGNRAILAEAIRALAGSQPRLRFELRDAEHAQVTEATPPTEAEWLARFKEAFDAEEILPDTEE